MEILDHHPMLDDALALWSEALGDARDAYRGHAYRVLNQTRRILGRTEVDDLLAVVSSFHDLGIWSDRTFDYLAPSRRRAVTWCSERAPDLDVALVERTIEKHHALRRQASRPGDDVVEAFRKADRVDLSRAWLAAGLDRSFLRELVTRWPYAGFHGRIVREALGWIILHPWRPLPMLR